MIMERQNNKDDAAIRTQDLRNNYFSINGASPLGLLEIISMNFPVRLLKDNFILKIVDLK